MSTIASYKDQLLQRLQEPEEAAAYFKAAFEDGDPEVFLLALEDLVEAYGLNQK